MSIEDGQERNGTPAGEEGGDEEFDTGSEEIVRCPLPSRGKNEIFGIATQLLGASKVRVLCEDGVTRLGRIPGKLRKRMWIREGDLLIVRPWDFQDGKADVKYRYTATQSKFLSRTGRLPETVQMY